jgi:hypothetical protein
MGCELSLVRMTALSESGTLRKGRLWLVLSKGIEAG